MPTDLQRFKRRVDTAIDRFDDLSYADLELVLQRRAQDMRELARDEGDLPTIELDDVEEYGGGDGG